MSLSVGSKYKVGLHPWVARCSCLEVFAVHPFCAMVQRPVHPFRPCELAFVQSGSCDIAFVKVDTRTPSPARCAFFFLGHVYEPRAVSSAWCPCAGLALVELSFLTRNRLSCSIEGSMILFKQTLLATQGLRSFRKVGLWIWPNRGGGHCCYPSSYLLVLLLKSLFWSVFPAYKALGPNSIQTGFRAACFVFWIFSKSRIKCIKG